MEPISLERMEKAVMFLCNSDVDYARAKSLYEGLVEQRKTVKAQIFLRSGQKTVDAKNADSYSSDPYKRHLVKMENAQLTFLTLQAQRNTASVIVDCWRSLNAARNKGQIV